MRFPHSRIAEFPILTLVLAALFLQSGCRPKEPKAQPGPPPSVAPAPASTHSPEQKTSDNTTRLRELDFSPFSLALEKFKPARAAEILSLIEESTIPQLQSALQSEKVTSEELTLLFLSRIRQYDEELRSYIELNPLCLEEAREADRQRKEGKSRGQLHGIPVSVKDNLGTAAPLHTTAGAEIVLNHSPSHDANVVAQLRHAGAIILGKASLSELAGALTTEPPGFNAVSGMGRNPYRRDLPVAGSSSGSAISTAASLALISIGTETSGSLIAPAAVNGVVAMKPSLNLVDSTGIVPLIRFQDSAGPMARSVTDAAILLAAMDNVDVDYAAALDSTALEGVTVGVLRDDIVVQDERGSDLNWLDLIDQGLTKAKATTRDVTLQGHVELVPVIFLGLALETVPYFSAAGAPVKNLADLQAYNAAVPERRIPRGQNMLVLASRFVEAAMEQQGLKETELGAAYQQLALETQASAAAILDQAFKENALDILVSLGNTHSPFYATAGYPAITVPLGLSEKGTPNGVTFIGRRGEDAKLLARAFAFEHATRYRVKVRVPFESGIKMK